MSTKISTKGEVGYAAQSCSFDCVTEMVNGWGSRVYANLSTCDSYYQTLLTCIHMTQINPEITSALASGCVVKCQKKAT